MKARVSYKVQRTINESFYAVMSTRAICRLFPYTTLFRSGSMVGYGKNDLHHRRGYGRDPREDCAAGASAEKPDTDRKSTRLNSSHVAISYAVFCLKKKERVSYKFQSTINASLNAATSTRA